MTVGPWQLRVKTRLEPISDILIAVGQIGMDNDDVNEIDINPLKIRDRDPIAVDALVILNMNA